LEILFLWWLTRKVGKVVKERGRKPGWFQVLAVVAWIGGGLSGIIVGTLLTQGEGGCAILSIVPGDVVALLGFFLPWFCETLFKYGRCYPLAGNPYQDSPQSPYRASCGRCAAWRCT
jgi:hypothetical protein